MLLAPIAFAATCSRRLRPPPRTRIRPRRRGTRSPSAPRTTSPRATTRRWSTAGGSPRLRPGSRSRATARADRVARCRSSSSPRITRFTPELARATGKPIVLIQNGIHSGEIEGKDASLELLRDIAVRKTEAGLRRPRDPARAADLLGRRARAEESVQPHQSERARGDGMALDADRAQPEPRLPQGRITRDARADLPGVHALVARSAGRQPHHRRRRLPPRRHLRDEPRSRRAGRGRPLAGRRRSRAA